jgi:hypothetical protein
VIVGDAFGESDFGGQAAISVARFDIAAHNKPSFRQHSLISCLPAQIL